jgi:outer membrane protein assembly factor BamB
MRALLLIIVMLFISGCQYIPEWVGADNEEKMEGERIAVLPSKSDLVADKSLAGIEVTLPPVAVNTIWFHQNFGQTYHLALKTPLTDSETTDIGEPPEKDGQRITSTPIIAKDIIYNLDGEGILTARELGDLSSILWEANLKTEEFDEGFFGYSEGVQKKKFIGGNMAYADGMLFVSTVAGEIIAFDARRGHEIWRRAFKLPIKSVPVAENGAVYFITINNQFYALDASNGKTLWKHAGISETTGMLGTSSAVIADDIILAPYSSGEIYALRKVNGAVLWGDSLAALNLQKTSLFALNDIDATPVVYDGVVYAVGYEGVLSATELETSKRIWEREISSLKTPWIAGNFLYILTTNDEIICIYRPDGRIKWITALPSYEDPDNHRDKISWNGPVLGGNRLFVVNQIGEIWVLSPKTGKVLRQQEIEEDVYLPPIISGRKMYILNNESDLTVLE